MPITMLNETQTEELQDALDHAQDIVTKQKKDASIINMGSNSWVAVPTEPSEYFSGTLIRVCFTNCYNDENVYTNSITGKRIEV